MKQASALELTEETFGPEVIDADGIVLVDFYGPRCVPCQRMAPIVDELAADDAFPKTCKLDTSSAPQIAERYGIRSVPTFLYFRNGSILQRSVGGMARSEFYAAVEQLERHSDAELEAQNFSAEFRNLLENGDKPDALTALREILEQKPELASAPLEGEEGLRPLDLVAVRLKRSCGRLLIEFGAEPGLGDLIALEYYDEALELLAKDPQTADVRNASGVPPVFFAILARHTELIDAFLHCGADLSDDRNGNLVTWAMRKLDFVTANKLVAAGVPVQNPDRLPEIVAKISEVTQDDSTVAKAVQFANAHTDNLASWRSDDGKCLAQILAENRCEASAKAVSPD